VPLCGSGLRGILANATATYKLGGGGLFGSIYSYSKYLRPTLGVLLQMLISIVGMQKNFFFRVLFCATAAGKLGSCKSQIHTPLQASGRS
jgi:hypothetical protein